MISLLCSKFDKLASKIVPITHVNSKIGRNCILSSGSSDVCFLPELNIHQGSEYEIISKYMGVRGEALPSAHNALMATVIVTSK